MSEWVSVRDREPESRGCYLAHSSRCSDVREALWTGNRWEAPYTDSHYPKTEMRGVTHWMPLPAPPSLPPTKEEALREAVECLNDLTLDLPVGTMNPQSVRRAMHEVVRRNILPRLRAALGE